MDFVLYNRCVGFEKFCDIVESLFCVVDRGKWCIWWVRFDFSGVYVEVWCYYFLDVFLYIIF